MGCDIHGTVELHRYDKWRGVTDIVWLVGRSYDSFGCLFGVRNSAGFAPLFDDRGFPDDASRRVDERFDEFGGKETYGSIGFHSATHCTLAEINSVDWDERAESRDRRLTVVDEDGEQQIKASYMRGVHEELTDDELARAKDGERVPVGGSDGEQHYAVHRMMRRKDALSGAWEWLLFEYLPVLAQRVESESDVRLTVWFDN